MTEVQLQLSVCAPSRCEDDVRLVRSTPGDSSMLNRPVPDRMARLEVSRGALWRKAAREGMERFMRRTAPRLVW